VGLPLVPASLIPATPYFLFSVPTPGSCIVRDSTSGTEKNGSTPERVVVWEGVVLLYGSKTRKVANIV